MADEANPVDRSTGPVTVKQTLSCADGQVTLAAWYRPGSAGTLFFLHGLGCSKVTFREAWTVEALSSYALLAVDLPGFGQSGRDPAFSYALEEQATLCAELIRQQVGPVHMVAHSLGGTVAALLPRDILTSLASFVSVEGRLLEASCSHSRVISRYDEDEFIERHFPVWCRRVEQDPTMAFDLKDADPLAFYRSACSLYRWVCGGDLPERLAACSSLPQAFIHGDRNSKLVERTCVPGTRVLAISDAGHFPMHDQPERFYAVLADYLGSLT